MIREFLDIIIKTKLRFLAYLENVRIKWHVYLMILNSLTYEYYLYLSIKTKNYVNKIGLSVRMRFIYGSHCVSKNLTPGRMLKNSFLIAQIIHWNNSFQNMYDMIKAKWTVWPGKLIFVTKKRLKSWTTFRIGWLWRVLEANQVTPGQLLGCPWRLWGLMVQTSYVEGRWH